ncbi:kinase-like domain-containing protein [Rhizophagus irregularis DAOM 181602=DAOM 197198]|uniref:Ste11p n=2 Tax=Rhizophagus irregularis TaxID=588596 RepID=A0A015I936_RHIIW|nr:Ste11p [Rhizophagus irregularis DAOM 197198w]GBC25081.1 kinase-like domain-containing protein [Rhizophagus irregularis DAOM 181602=DAOM 197198]
MHSQINYAEDIVFEWIPYIQFDNIKEITKIEKNSSITFTTEYLAIWKDGPLYYESANQKFKRQLDQNVILKYLYNSQNIIDEVLNEVKEYTIERGRKGLFSDKTKKFIYGISQHPNTKDYIMVLHCKIYCKKCYKNINIYEGCKLCLIDSLKENFINWTSGNKIIDNIIQEMQLKTSDKLIEWIPYNQFINIKKIGKGGFSTVYSAIWKDGPLYYDSIKQKFIRVSYENVALKCLDNSQNITYEFLKEIKGYSIIKQNNIIKIYGISQNPDTKNYIIVLQHAEGGNFSNWVNMNYKDFNWKNKIKVLGDIIEGLKEIHEKQMVHRDFHTGNILFNKASAYISDMGLCGKVEKIDKISETKIYGVMPYVAPEVLRKKPYTQAADIYSFGMIMYFVATGKQPFANHEHNHILVLNICGGIRPEINELELPKCYINLMKRCWDSNPDNRPNTIEIKEEIKLFYNSYKNDDDKIKKQFEEAEKFKKEIALTITHPQAIYTSQLLNPFTEDFSITEWL